MWKGLNRHDRKTQMKICFTMAVLVLSLTCPFMGCVSEKYEAISRARPVAAKPTAARPEPTEVGISPERSSSAQLLEDGRKLGEGYASVLREWLQIPVNVAKGDVDPHDLIDLMIAGQKDFSIRYGYGVSHFHHQADSSALRPHLIGQSFTVSIPAKAAYSRAELLDLIARSGKVKYEVDGQGGLVFDLHPDKA
jgi:hypothetical protein